MKLSEFLDRFGDLSDEAFLAHFQHPFLLEEGELDLGQGAREREIFLLRPGQGGSLSLGRAASCDLRIRNAQVSSKHALLFPSAGGKPWQLMDANSTNGTFLDGVKLATGDRVSLVDGALLRFGLEARLTFLDPEGLLAVLRRRERRSGRVRRDESREDLTSTTRYDMQSLKTAAEVDDDLEAEAGQEVRLVCPPYPPVKLVEGQPLVLGRSAGSADVVLPHAHVSRRHCQIERRDDGVWIKDLGSANGSFVCGVRVEATPMQLLPGKPLEVGPFRLTLEGEGLLDADPSQTQMVSTGETSTRMGSLEKTPLVDLLQAIETGEQTGVLTVTGRELEGTITFRRGEPYNARTTQDDWGADAVRRLLKLTVGKFVLDRDETRIGERSIKLSFGEILLDDFLREGG